MEFDGAEIAGDGATAVSRRGVSPQARRKAQARPRSSQASASAPECCVCGGQDGDLSKIWRREHLHKHCWNGVRCYLRMHTSKSAKESEQRLFNRKRQDWQAAVRPLVVVDSATRRPRSLREDARESVVQHSPERYEEKQRIKDILLLSKDRYKRHKKDNDGWATDEASSEFERVVEAQSDQELDAGGSPRARVETAERIRVITRQVYRKRSSSARSLEQPPLGESDGSVSDTSAAPASSRKRSRHGASPAPLRTPQMSRTGGRSRIAPSPPPAAQEHSASASASLVAIGPRRLGVVEFLTAKAKLVKDTESLIGNATNKSSLVSRMQATLVKMNDEQIKQAMGDPSAIILDINTMVKDIEGFKATLSDMKIDELAPKTDQLEAFKVTLGEKVMLGEEVLEGMKFVLGQGRDEQRKQQMSVRYRRARLCSRLIAGGFPKTLANTIAMSMSGEVAISTDGIELNPAGDEFNPMRITLWDSTHEASGMPTIEKFSAALGVSIISLCVCLCV